MTKSAGFIFAHCLIFFLLGPLESYAAHVVYMNEKEALEWAFPKADQIEEKVLTLTREESTEIEAETNARVYEGDKKIYNGKKGEKVQGYAVITNEIGKFELITFIVKVTPNLKVEKVALMVYRESRGGEIVRKRFLNQYKGKRRSSPLRINHDIINITGATMSVRSMNRGIRKVLVLIEDYLIPQLKNVKENAPT